MEIELFVFSEKVFQFPKVHENEAKAKHNKHNLKRGFPVTFEVKNS